MNKSKTLKLFLLVTLATGLLMTDQAYAFQFGDATFTQKLCNAWNRSSLPKRLAEKGKEFGRIKSNGWIDYDTGESKVPKGYQKIVFSRKECKGWTKMQLVLEKQEDGTAKCTSSGKYDGKNVTWQFIPKTYHWYNFARSFGMFDFPKILGGFIGPMWFARKNQGNFQVFWRLGAKIGLNSDWKTGCKGIDVEDTVEEINDYKKKFNIK